MTSILSFSIEGNVSTRPLLIPSFKSWSETRRLLNQITCFGLKEVMTRSYTQDYQRKELDTWPSLLFDSSSRADTVVDKNLKDSEEKDPVGPSSDGGTNRCRDKDGSRNAIFAEGELQKTPTTKKPRRTSRQTSIWTTKICKVKSLRTKTSLTTRSPGALSEVNAKVNEITLLPKPNPDTQK